MDGDTWIAGLTIGVAKRNQFKPVVTAPSPFGTMTYR